METAPQRRSLPLFGVAETGGRAPIYPGKVFIATSTNLAGTVATERVRSSLTSHKWSLNKRVTSSIPITLVAQSEKRHYCLLFSDLALLFLTSLSGGKDSIINRRWRYRGFARDIDSRCFDRERDINIAIATLKWIKRVQTTFQTKPYLGIFPLGTHPLNVIHSIPTSTSVLTKRRLQSDKLRMCNWQKPVKPNLLYARRKPLSR